MSICFLLLFFSCKIKKVSTVFCNQWSRGELWEKEVRTELGAPKARVQSWEFISVCLYTYECMCLRVCMCMYGYMCISVHKSVCVCVLRGWKISQLLSGNQRKSGCFCTQYTFGHPQITKIYV